MREEAPSCRAQTRKRRERTSTGQRNPAGRRSSFFWSWESPPPVAGAGWAGSLAGTAQATRRRSSAEAGVIETPDCGGGAARYESASATDRAVWACSSCIITPLIQIRPNSRFSSNPFLAPCQLTPLQSITELSLLQAIVVCSQLDVFDLRLAVSGNMHAGQSCFWRPGSTDTRGHFIA